MEIHDDCQINAKVVPTVLNQKIGTTPDIQNKEFLESTTDVILSYWSMKMMLKSLQPKEYVRREDGRMVYVSWSATKSTPKVLPMHVNADKSVTGDHIRLPLLPEDSEWLIYDFPQNYERSSCTSFTSIGLIILTKDIASQKMKADVDNKVVKLKLEGQEQKEAKSTVSLYLLPRVGNLVVLGPMKKDICKSMKVTSDQTLSCIKHIHEDNFLKSSIFWDESHSMDKEKLAKPVDRIQYRCKKKDESVASGKSPDLKGMPKKVIPESIIKNNFAEVAGPSNRPSSPFPLTNLNSMNYVKAPFHIICSAVPLQTIGCEELLQTIGCEERANVVGTSASESEKEDNLESVQDVLSDEIEVITID